MAHPDRKSVSVATGSDHRQIAVCQLHALGDRKSAAMDAVKAVSVNVTGDAAGAADPRNNSQILRLEPYRCSRALDCRLDGEIAASRTPVWFDVIAELFKGCHSSPTPPVLCCRLHFCIVRTLLLEGTDSRRISRDL
ncbi:hypothetical protein D1872_272650 [compost metagenome]